MGSQWSCFEENDDCYSYYDESTRKPLEGLGPILYSAECAKNEFKMTKFADESVLEGLYNAVEKFADRRCVGKRTLIHRHSEKTDDGKIVEKLELANEFQWITYREYLDTIKHFSSGLQKLTNVSINSHLVIYAETQKEWMMTTFAAFMRRLTIVTVYATLGASGASYGINQTKAPIVVVDAKLLPILVTLLKEIPHVKHVITLGACKNEDKELIQAQSITVTDFYDVVALGKQFPIKPLKPVPDDNAVIMYTSGTTGNPKGVVISHANIFYCCEGLRGCMRDDMNITCADVYLAYLPLAHIMEMVAEIMILQLGISVGFGNPHTLTDTGVKLKLPESRGDLVVLQPTFVVFAPAVMDKVYQGIHKKMRDLGGVAQYMFDKAMEAGAIRYEDGKLGTGPLWNCLIGRKLQALIGGRVRLIISGSAPLSRDVHIFMQSVFNCPLRQGYGLTETCAASCVQRIADQSTCAVGAPLGNTCIRLADWEDGNYRVSDENDKNIGMPRGEVLIGGNCVAKGYFTDPANPDTELVEKNKNDFVTLDGIRFFRTGDIGQITEVGTLNIIDRKKDLWKGPTGEYVSLAKVEAAMKLSKYVDAGLCMCYGKLGGNAPVGLICANPVLISEIGREKNLDLSFAELCRRKEVIDVVFESIMDFCRKVKLERFEFPMKIGLISDLWTPDNDMLTAAMKLKRPQIVEKHRADIDLLYN